MSNYKIMQYSFDRAKQLNLIIKPSKNKNKKLDLYNNDGVFLNSIGDINYFDFPYYLKLDVNNAKKRQQKGINIINSKQYLSSRILW